MTIKKLTAESFIEMQQGVLHFNEVMGNKLDNPELIPLYQNLTLEELVQEDELIYSITMKDKVGILDGICDVVFTGFYYAMLKGHFLDDLTELLNRLCEESSLQEEKQSLQYYADKILFCIRNGQSNAAQRWTVLMMISHQEDFDFLGGFREVLRSNMSKYVKTTEMSLEEAEKACDAVGIKGRYGEVFFEVVNHGQDSYYSFRAKQDIENGVDFGSEGKMIKVEGFFSEPELAHFVLS